MWMRIHIIAGTLNARGGGELVTIAFIRFITEQAKEVYLYTIDEPDPTIIHTFPLEFTRALRYVRFRPLGMVYAKTLWRGAPYIRLLRMFLTLNGKEELVVNLSADTVPIPAHICFVHFPYFGVGLNPTLRSKGRKVAHLTTLKLCRLVLVNSNFTREVLCHISPDICKKTLVLYPPILIEPIGDDELLRSLAERDNMVLTVSRFSKEKKLETVLDIAQRVKQSRFVIVGTLIDINYYKCLKERIAREGLNNVELMPNLTFRELHTLRRRCKIYLHTMPYEHFGISIVEAMASGCVPVVHKSGGPWQDILEQKEECGYAYESIDEASTKIEKLLTDPEVYLEKSLATIRRSRRFTYELFKDSLASVLKMLTVQKLSSTEV